MILKKKKKNIFFFITLVVFAIFLLFNISKIKPKTLKTEIHSINEFISSYNLGYSSLNNITNDGSEKFLNINTEPIYIKMISLIKKLPNIIYYKFNNIGSNKFKTLHININFKNFQILLNDRRKAINSEFIKDYNFQKVSAKVYFDGKEKKVKLKIKGLLETHWRNKRRMSLKIELKNNEAVLGYNEFSIQKPRERQWPYNYVFEKILSSYDILTTNSDFLNVVVNGEKWGVMLVEESVGKTFLENKRKKEGLIFKFGDNRAWYDGEWFASKNEEPFWLYRLGADTLFYHVYNMDQYLNNDISQNQLRNRELISYILEGFSQYNKDLFLTNKMNQALLISTAWGQLHNLTSNNTVYYLNPYLLKLEPIIRDQYPINKLTSIKNLQQFPPPVHFLTTLENKELKNKNIEIIKSLENNLDLIDENFLDAKKIFPVDILKTSDVLRDNINKIYNKKEEFILYDPQDYYYKINNKVYLNSAQTNDWVKYKNTIKKDKSALSLNQLSRVSDLIQMIHYSNGDIKINNLLPYSVKIESLKYNKKNILNKKMMIPGYLSGKNPLIIKTNIKGFQDEKFYLKSTFEGKTSIVKNKITLIKNIKNPLIESNYLPKFISKKGNEYLIPSGSWVIKKDLIISGNLTIEPGSKIKFEKNTSLIINGSIRAEGLKNKKIIFENLDTEWDGIYVYNANKKSILSHVNISRTSGVKKGILNLTGGVVFYKSDVDINYTIFNNSNAEDALNIINSKYNILNSQFINSNSDAFDSDFSQGIISDSKFLNVGGDALDFSGSSVNIKNINAKNIIDKAVSAGEASIIKISNFGFTNIGVAIAAKDSSYVDVDNCYVKNPNFIAFMTYIKKKNYSYPTMNIKNCKINFKEFTNNLSLEDIENKKYFRQTGTQLNVNDIKNIVEKNLNVDLLYETSTMRK